MTRRSACIALGLLSLLLAGCALTMQEDRAQFLDAPAMERTLANSGLKSAVGENAWPREEWWRAFRSAELDRIVDKALRDNQNLRKAEGTLRAADAVVQIAGARLLPEVQATFGMRQSRNPLHGVVASYNPAQGGLQKTMAFINPLALTWELDFWGKNRALLDAAIGEAAAQEGELEQARLLLTSGAARAYLRGYATARQLEVASALTRLRRELVALAETRYQTGLDTLDGAQIARANLELAIRREAAARALLTLQQDALARLMGEGPDAGRDLFAGRRAPSPAQPALPRNLPIEMLIHRPDLAAALQRAEAAAQRIHVAKTMFLPSINLAITGGFEGSVTTTKISKLAGYLFTPSAIGYAVAPGVRLPIFQGGRLTGNLEVQRAEYDQAVDAYNETLLQSAQQVADSIANLKRARAEYEAQSRFLRATRAQLDLARVRLRDGMKDRREIIAEQADLLESAFAQRAIEGDRLVAAVDLYQALGGGYADGPHPAEPKPAPEADPITPTVEAIQSLGGG
ncbi:MAG: efflux transporter outer membrane subunit [Methylocystis silviterrae]|uniref:efflux transporter outer membrane subunit n=1 Tax=Methylocystis silviterrae TaxID=2743612 RepID=UPI003C7909CE